MIRAAIVGAGIGAEHLAGYRALPARFAVKTFCDLDTARARSVTGGDPGIAITGSLDAVLEDPDIDLVDVCLPPLLHADVTIKALEAGKHVICEKPIGRSLAEVDRMQTAADAAGRQVFPVFQYRYGRAMAQLDALIAADLAGKAFVASLETHWSRDAAYYAVPWRGTWAGESGGALLGHAIHAHDLLCHVLGPVAEVTGFADTRVNAIETEDCAAIAYRMQSGALATSSVTLGAGDDTSRLRFCFEGFTAESGTLPYAPAQGDWRFTARTKDLQTKIDAVLAGVEAGHAGFAGYLDAVADTLEGGPSKSVTLAQGRRSIELVTALYHSVRSGGPVELPLGPRSALYNGWTPGLG
ncbi:Gfo/Idh/MocA family oxidoreductase [Salipiger sp. IMCC34102]|uniref:Gfo/Idh/MocA family protein n=1 Tax=Salipiger sp. IMCC34102 TaxID=2510647 RepID=UPI00101CA662|nr:Gfo/Idh/MocA family oxidoreductase [Salipiger sp. IMCC34102]RYH03516.1 Gfo/Idh/MocA family oxidoreductase [Salipiger sp. IMCC34102]